jgi:hypothetical protein
MGCFVVERDNVVILSSNLLDEDESYIQWSPDEIYDSGVEVQFGKDIFRSLSAENTAMPVAESLTIKWKYLKKANKWAAFDDANNTLTKNEFEIEYVVQSRFVDYIGFLNLTANTVKIELFNINDDMDVVTPIKTVEKTAMHRDVYSYKSHLSAVAEYKKIVLIELFPYLDTKMRIRLSMPFGYAAVGNIIYGRKYDLGLTLATTSLSMDISNLFDIDIDAETGALKEVPLLPRRDLTIPILIDTSAWERVTNKLISLMGKACLYVAVEEVAGKIPNIALWGFYKNIRTPIGVKKTEYELVIKGVS